MQEKSIQKVISLIRKTGDRMIIFDQEGFSYVLMNVDDYEDLLLARSGVAGLTEEELLDKINREIAVWKSNQEDDTLNEFDPVSESEITEILDEELSKDISDEEAEDNAYYVEPL
jgi:aminoglycoside phosphotransferase family enzyme